jgi:hypothetical protein
MSISSSAHLQCTMQRSSKLPLQLVAFKLSSHKKIADSLQFESYNPHPWRILLGFEDLNHFAGAFNEQLSMDFR